MPVGQRFKIAAIAGIPIYLSTSWVLMAALITFSEYQGFSNSFAVSSDSAALWLSLGSAALFFGSILLHEGAHAFAARRLDLPVWGITLSGWGGFTETPSSSRGPFGEFVVSAAGPATNVLLGVSLLAIGSATETSNPLLSVVATHYGRLNLFLFLLNSLPGFPLDGGRVLMAGAWKVTGDRMRAMRIASRAGYLVAGAIAIYGVSRLQNQDQFVGIWSFLIAWIIFSSARASEARSKVLQTLGDGRVRDAMGPAPDMVPADMSLSEALDVYLRANPNLEFAVAGPDGQVAGTISMESARKTGSRDPMSPVRDAMVRAASVPRLEADMLLADAVDVLGSREGMVLLEGRLVGRLSVNDIQDWLNSRIGGTPSQDPTGPLPPRPDIGT